MFNGMSVLTSAYWQDTWLFAVSQQLYVLSISHTDTSTSLPSLSTYVHMYTSTIPALDTMILVLLPCAAVVSGMLASSYLCLLSQHVYKHYSLTYYDTCIVTLCSCCVWDVGFFISLFVVTTCSGVWPSEHVVFTSAPYPTRTSTILECSRSTAKRRGVNCFRWFFAFRSQVVCGGMIIN